MSDKNIENFLQAQENMYQQKMVEQLDSLDTMQDLENLHSVTKTEMKSSLEVAWKEQYPDADFPNDLTEKFSLKVDKTFELCQMHVAGKLKNIPGPEPATTTAGIPSGSEYAIGIDLGTTMCCVAVVYNGKVEIVPNRTQNNARTTPSYVSFHSDGTDTFGYIARDRAFRYPETTIYDAKRMIGRPWNDPKLQNDRLVWPFQVIEENGNPKIKIKDRTRYPHEISAKLLARFRVMAEEFLHLSRGSIKKAVITVPAYFSEPQRRATNEAGVCAGLQVLNVLSEPTAAAIAYAQDRRVDGTRKVLIYDLGGGTFDVSIGIVDGKKVEILCVRGDAHLGGQDFDHLLMDHCIQSFKNTTQVDLLEGRDSEDNRIRDSVLKVLSRLKAECCKAKEWLTGTDFTTVEIYRIKGDLDINVEVTKTLLEQLCEPLVDKTLQVVAEAIEDAKSKGIKGKEDIDDIILVGGSTRMPLVVKKLKEFFPGKQLCLHINPDEAVAIGAAIQANELKEGNANANNFLDVTPLTLGIDCLEDVFSKIIPRNERIPCQFEKTYNTSEDNQRAMRLTIRQGESDKASENIKLGEFFFEGIPPGPATTEKIKVTMTITGKGILNVKAISMGNGVETAITVTSNQLGMSAEEMAYLSTELDQMRL